MPWKQGRLLLTLQTMKWPQAERDRIDAIERRTAFAYFKEVDEGRSRQYVFIYDSKEECAQAIAAHNRARAKRYFRRPSLAAR
ncbi:MAG: hypothetical protein DMF06_15095, partial [Verrucomicrobia bacterium]